MAVQKSRKSRAKRGTRRAHNALTGPTLGTDPTTGETHHRHNVTELGYYRGKKVVLTKADRAGADEEEE